MNYLLIYFFKKNFSLWQYFCKIMGDIQSKSLKSKFLRVKENV